MKQIYIHPLPVRIWHWVNALGFLLLIASGLQIRYLDLFQIVSFKFAVISHHMIGFALVGNFFIWLCFYLFTDKITVYHPELSPTKYFNESFRQMYYYGYGIFRGEPNPHHPNAKHKFNALQSMMYQIIMMLLVPTLFFTGIMLWDITRFPDIVDILGGIRVVDTIHVLLFIFSCGFIIVHTYLGSLGHTPFAHFKAMMTGYEDVEDDHE